MSAGHSLSLGGESSDRTSTRIEHGFAFPAMARKSQQGNNPDGLTPTPSGNYRSTSREPFFAAGCGGDSAAFSSSIVCRESVLAQSNAEAGLSMVPYTNPRDTYLSYGRHGTDYSTPYIAVDANESRHVHPAIEPNRGPTPTEAFSPDPDPGPEQAIHGVLHMENTKDRKKGFSLPDSLARTFDSSEMEQIANAIVRVSKYGLSSEAHNSELSSQSSLEPAGSRVLPSVGAFTVQCANCFKWRLIPSKEEYEQIRQNILEKPFFCRSWRPGASCDDPPELGEDLGLLWAIDKPNIPCPPDGWQRLLVIRGEGCCKFSDIYYVSPFGKRLRSMPEVERYLLENPELVDKGASLRQFSFTSPKALDNNYCKKRTVNMRGSMSGNIIPMRNPSVPESWQSQGEQSPMSFAESGALTVEPLRAWMPSPNTMMCHQAGEVDASGSVW